MILPTILRTTQESLKTVPQSYREGALGLRGRKVAYGPYRGAVQRHRRHRHRLHFGRGPDRGGKRGAAVHRRLRSGAQRFFTALHSSSATLTVALYVYANERGETTVAFSIATILMLLTLLINLSAVFLGRKLKKN